MLNGHPCRVTKVKHAKAGKHGGIKVRLMGVCLLSGTKHDCFFPGHLQLQEPEVVKSQHQICSFDEKEGVKYFQGDELASVPLTHPDAAVATLLKDKQKAIVQGLMEAYESDKDAENDFEVVLVAAPVVLNGKTKWVQTIADWKAAKAKPPARPSDGASCVRVEPPPVDAEDYVP
eukprot:g78329.t1